MKDINVILTDNARIHLQLEENTEKKLTITIARMVIDGLPMQSRYHFGGMYPSKQDILDGLMTYGFQVEEWVDNLSDDAKKEVRQQGILSKSWFEENFDLYYKEE